MMPNRKQVLTRGVIGNTSDFGSEESRFEPWRVNMKGIISKRIVPYSLGCFSPSSVISHVLPPIFRVGM